MNRIIGILNYKGGTGKTTTVVNLAAGLANKGSRVLCLDLDAQGNLATYFGITCKYTLSHILLGEKNPRDCIIKIKDNLDLIANDSNILQAEGKLWQTIGYEKGKHVLSDKMTNLNEYDYIILDFSPSISFTSEAGLLYINELIVPVSMDYLSLIGARKVIETLKIISKKPEYHLKLYLFIPTFYYERLRKDRQIMEILHKYFGDKLTAPIRSSVKLSEASSHKTSIYEYAPQSFGVADYNRLVERIIADE